MEMSLYDSEAEVDVNVGTVIDGRYEILEPIASGASGVVYRAMQVTVEREVAVKILKKKVEGNPRLRQRFETEARAVAKLRDPHCITLFDFGYDEDANRLYMVFDYVTGQMLEELLPGPVPPEAALGFVVQIASALHHAHELGILHRDLKPANILLDRTQRGERARVLDFGLARIVREEPKHERMTVQGEIYGTPAYMSPEQSRGELDVSPATDIYALGCIAFELLHGQLPFEGRTIDILLAHQNKAPPAVTASVPPKVAALIQRMLAKKPGDRPSATEVIATIAPHVDLDISLEMTLGAATRSGIHLEDAIVAALDVDGSSRSVPVAWLAAALFGFVLAVVLLASC